MKNGLFPAFFFLCVAGWYSLEEEEESEVGPYNFSTFA